MQISVRSHFTLEVKRLSSKIAWGLAFEVQGLWARVPGPEVTPNSQAFTQNSEDRPDLKPSPLPSCKPKHHIPTLSPNPTVSHYIPLKPQP